jgi:two-component system response regulator FlrC
MRFVAATNQCLRTLVRDRRFREDLFFRLDVLTLTVPPLRDRVEDIVPLAEHFARRWARSYGWPDPQLSDDVVDRLRRHAWPGNVRELENVIHRAVIESEGGMLQLAHVTLDLAGAAARPAPDEGEGPRAWKDVQRDLIFATLAQVGGNRRRAAEILGIGERTLRYKLRQYREAVAP